MEIAALEIARMSEEIDGLRAELVSTLQLRLETEAHLESVQERMNELEQEIREECYAEMESRLASEMARWKSIWAAEQDNNDEHLDRKLEIYTRSIDAADDPPPQSQSEDKENAHKGPMKEVIGDLESENERLRREVEMLRREASLRSPSKRLPLRESRLRDRDRSATPELGGTGGVQEAFERMSVHEDRVERHQSKSPVKKVKKLTTRKWDLVDEDDDEML